MKEFKKQEQRSGTIFIFLFIAVAASIAIMFHIYYRSFEKHYRGTLENQLSSINSLKAKLVAQWYKERAGDAAMLYGNGALYNLVRKLIANSDTTFTQKELRSWLEHVQYSFQYNQIRLLNKKLQIMFSVPDSCVPACSAITENAAESMRRGKVVFVDYYRNENDDQSYMALLIPVVREGKKDGPIGAIALRADPKISLQPLISEWPDPGESFESVLFRPQGDSLQFLSKLKFKQVPASSGFHRGFQEIFLSAKGLHAPNRILYDRDYRNVSVMARVDSVSGTSWFMLSKMDTEELHRSVRAYRARMAGVASCILAVASIAFWSLWRQRSIRYYRDKASMIARAAEQEAKHRDQLIQADKMASLGRIVSGVAHEINNPNNFIMLNAPLLRKAWETALPVIKSREEETGQAYIGKMRLDEFTQYVFPLVDGILDGSRRIARIVADLKDYVRPDACDLNGHIDVTRVVHSAVNLMRNTLTKKNVDLHLSMSKAPVQIQGSSQRLEQVVINLLQNSCDALVPGGGRAISIGLDESGKDEIRLCIRDTGCGIASNDMPHITEPFFTTKRGNGGTGLGLSVSGKIVADHGGRLQFESEVGKGTTAILTLPRRCRDNGKLHQIALS
jgi:signal transduction histidine kinase